MTLPTSCTHTSLLQARGAPLKPGGGGERKADLDNSPEHRTTVRLADLMPLRRRGHTDTVRCDTVHAQRALVGISQMEIRPGAPLAV